MGRDLQERSRWLARHVLPYEGLLRAKLRDFSSYGLDVEDVIQETYTRMLSTASLESIRYPKQYALLTAKAIIIDHIRHSRVVSIALSGSLETLEVPEPDVSAERRVEFQQEVLAVSRALQRLPKLWREVLILRRVEGLSGKDVAAELGISERTVEKYLGKGARQLAKVIALGEKKHVRSSTTLKEAHLRDADDQPGH